MKTSVKYSPATVLSGVSGGAYKSLSLQVVCFLGGLLVSRGAVFGDYVPFGISFAAAVPYENMISASIGTALGYILLMQGESFRCVAALVTVFALRWLFSDISKISKSRIFPPLIAAVPLLATGSVIVLATGKGSKELVMCVLEALLAGVGAYFLSESASLAAGSKGITTFNQQEIACIVMTGCIFLLSANSLSIGGISVGRILAVTLVLFCGYYGSVAGGCISGTATGIVFGLGLDSFNFLALAYSFGGLMCGLFSYVGKIGTAASFLLCSVVASVGGGVTKQTAAMFYESVIAAVIFIFVPKEWGNKLAMFVTPRTGNGDSDSLRRGVIMRLDLASKAIRSINDAVSTVSHKLSDYYSSELETVFSRTIDENCKRCGMRAFCLRDGEDKHLERLSATAPLLKNSGDVGEGDVKRIFSKRCCKPEEVARSLNENYRSYRACLAAESRAAQIRSVVASQFSGLSEILDGLKNEFEKYECYDTATAEKICAALKVHGFFAFDCSVRCDTLGRLSAELELADENRRLLKDDTLTAELSKLCGRTLSPPEVCTVGNRLRVTFSERPKLDVQVGSAQHVCGGGRLCGDSYNYFSDGSGRFVTVISDGMGTGGRAAVDGSMAVSIISKLTKSGLGFDASLSAANSALMVKSNDESLATADILSIDLFTGDTEIMKAGAPVTFLRKSGKVIRIEPQSLPAGILTDIKLTHDETNLSDGDIVLMVTDGAVSTGDSWIAAMLRDFEGADIQVLVNDIIDEAMIGGSFGRDDDITVIGVRVIEA